jgi:hypothetical protein
MHCYGFRIGYFQFTPFAIAKIATNIVIGLIVTEWELFPIYVCHRLYFLYRLCFYLYAKVIYFLELGFYGYVFSFDFPQRWLCGRNSREQQNKTLFGKNKTLFRANERLFEKNEIKFGKIVTN